MESSYGRVYEDFEPSAEWVREPALDTLQVYIPGFTKEQLKVQVASNRKLRINGERALKDNKFSRFHKEFALPLDVEINKISANFRDGTLFIKLPKIVTQADKTKVPAQPQTRQETTQTDEPPQPQMKQQDSAQAVPPKTTVVEKPTGTSTNGTTSNGDKGSQKSPTEPSPARISSQEEAKEEATPKATMEKMVEKTEPSKEVAATKLNEKNDVKTDDAMKDKDDATAKSKVDENKKVIGGLAAEYKQPRMWVNLVVIVLIVVVLGLYIRNWIGTIREPED